MPIITGQAESRLQWADWFRDQLRASATGLVWGFQLIPDRFHRELPPYPKYLGEWSPARHLWHIAEYERCEASDQPDEALISAFMQVREDQIGLINQLDEETWVADRETVWGTQPLWKVVAKTYQHTFEHGDTLMRMGLWWEELLEQKAQRAAAKPKQTDSSGSMSQA